MKVLTVAASAAFLAVAVSACANDALSPRSPLPGAAAFQRAAPKGTGIALDIVPTLQLPLVGGGSVTISQSAITNFALVQNLVAPLVGLEGSGTLSGTAVDALGNTIGLNIDPFTADVVVANSGSGQCGLVTLDLTNLKITTAAGLLTVAQPVNVAVDGSGAVGSLLCNLGSALSGLTSGLTGSASGASGLVNALNNQIGG